MTRTVLVAYRSHYGSSRRYAEWLAQGLHCPAAEWSRVRPAELAGAETLVLVGGVYAGCWSCASGVKKRAVQLADKEVVACFCGLTPRKEVDLDALKKQNIPAGDAAAFWLPGDFEFAALGLVHRGLIRLARRDLLGAAVHQTDGGELAPVLAHLQGEE
ncbi:flavodoxin domain-containing protein [Bittarella massiliensis (ex Durand et al. 2017)]|uniref:flavodoxin domain-containing protein n=1 Tax=Bittarella massiliensis (ex Durand et al. 2017) TaxID=1720313 RepID=UPI001AA1ADF0|nr:flavodoxin domain-containing protein [Bittarella massiliensis (ex Durand et al. 2017)]MBO1679694.1 hypothetical protein [Bittarella massiliensis (ex Durand et al. 2017)]